MIETRRENHGTKRAIRGAYRMTGGNSFYDGMITCSTLSGKAVCRLVWAMNKAENDAYLEKALSGIPEHFSGKLLEVPVGTGILTMPVYQTMPEADITCLDYSADMMRQALEKADRLHLKNVTFRQGDVGALSLCRRHLRHRFVAERLSRFSGQGSRLSGGFPGFEARRDILRLLLCEGRAQADGLVCPACL